MELVDILKYALIPVCSALMVAILLQSGKGGLGTVFGGSSGGEAFRSKRGMEAFLYNSTIVLAIIFAALSIGIAVLNA